MYKLNAVVDYSFGAKLLYRTPDMVEKQLMISKAILKKLLAMGNTFRYAIVVLITFRDKFSKKIINNDFDEKVIKFTVSSNITEKVLEELAMMTKSDLAKLL